jgi:hypothetical protein
MCCDSVWDLLSVYADGETTSDETAMVEAHIAVCADCTCDLAFMQSTTVTLNGIEEIEPPASLRSAILAATVDRPAFPERFREALRRALSPAPARYGAVAAAGAALALAIVLVQQPAPMDNPVAYQPTEPAQPRVMAQAPRIVEPTQPIVPGLPVLRDDPQPHPVKATKRQPVLETADVEIAPEKIKPFVKAPAVGGGARQKPSAPLFAQRLNDFKTKVGDLNGPSNGNSDPEPDPVIMEPMQPMEMRTAGGGMPETTGGEPKTDPGGPTAAIRYTLVAGVAPDTSGQIASLADLKRSLKQRGTDWQARGIEDAIRAKEIRVPVLRRSF